MHRSTSVRMPAAAASAVLVTSVFAAPAAAQALVEPMNAAYLTAGRFWSLVAASLGVAGVVIGGLAVARSANRTGPGTRVKAIIALTGGLAASVIGTLVVAPPKAVLAPDTESSGATWPWESA